MFIIYDSGWDRGIEGGVHDAFNAAGGQIRLKSILSLYRNRIALFRTLGHFRALKMIMINRSWGQI